MIVDVHTHYLPADFVNARSLTTADEAYSVTIHSSDGSALFEGATTAAGFEVGQLVDPNRRLADMAGMGIDVQVLSVPPPFGFFYTDEPQRALDICRALNDRFADVVREYPGKFVGLATLPLQQPAMAVAELIRAVDELGLRGAAIASRVGELNLDDPSLDPFFLAAQELGVPVFVHSTRGLGAERLRNYHLGNLIGNPTEDAIAAAALIFGGVLDRFPALKVYLAHGGGSCPFIVDRWDRGWRVRPEARLPAPPSTYLRRLAFDSLTHGTRSLQHLLDVSDDRHVMLGTDYPYDMGEPNPVAAVYRLSRLAPRGQAAVLGGNAAEYFGIG